MLCQHQTTASKYRSMDIQWFRRSDKVIICLLMFRKQAENLDLTFLIMMLLFKISIAWIIGHADHCLLFYIPRTI